MLKTVALAGATAALVIGSIAVAQTNDANTNNNSAPAASSADQSGAQSADQNSASSAAQNGSNASATTGERG